MPANDLTALLESHRAGDEAAMRELVDRVYPTLKDMARRQLRRREDALNTTGVVHDAFVRFAERRDCRWESRDHFFAFAARVMRQVVVDHLRARYSAKRGAGRDAVPLDELRVAAPASHERALLVDELLDGLGEVDDRLVRVVECRYFAGLTEEETARVLGVTARTVQRDWRRARAWLQHALDGPVS